MLFRSPVHYYWQRPEVSYTVNEKAAEPENEELTLNTTHFEPVTDEVLNNYNNVNNSEAEYSRAAEPEIAATDFVTPGMNMKFNVSSWQQSSRKLHSSHLSHQAYALTQP